jgi:hypothetical protein
MKEKKFYEGKWYEETGRICNRCKSPVYNTVSGLKHRQITCLFSIEFNFKNPYITMVMLGF